MRNPVLQDQITRYDLRIIEVEIASVHPYRHRRTRLRKQLQPIGQVRQIPGKIRDDVCVH